MLSGTANPQITTPPVQPDFLQTLGSIFNQAKPIVDQISGFLNPTGSNSGASTTGTTGNGIPLTVNLGTDAKTTITNVEVFIVLLAIVIMAVWILA